MNRPRGTIGIVAALILLVCAWQAYIWATNTPSYVLPNPWQTLQTAGANLSLLAQADCLIVRAPHAPPAKTGSMVEIVPLASPSFEL